MQISKKDNLKVKEQQKLCKLIILYDFCVILSKNSLSQQQMTSYNCLTYYITLVIYLQFQVNQKQLDFVMQQKILMFRTITEDQDIDQKEVVKFIDWGKGDIQQALNYYFINLQKGKIKRNNKTKSKSVIENKPQEQNKFATKNIDRQEKTQQMKQKQRQKYRVSEISMSSQEQSLGNSKDAFQVLRKGSIQHKKTHDFIKQVREIYNLPIKGKPQKQLIAASKSCLPQHEGKIPEQFYMVDCLTQAFNPSNIQQIINTNRKSNAHLQNQIQMKQINNQKQRQRQRQRQSQAKYQQKRFSKSQFIQLSISEQIEDQINEQDSFKDLQQYQYKHVYTSSQRATQQKSFQNIQKQIIHEHASQCDKQQEQQVQNKKPAKTKRQGFKKKSKNAKSKNKISKQKQVSLPLVPHLNQYSQSKLKIKDFSQNDEEIQQEEFFVGQYLIKGFCTQKLRFQNKSIGDRVQIKSFIEQIKTKKKNFGRNAQRNMNMRIQWGGRQIGRISDEEVRIIMPLMDQKLIRIDFFLQDAPQLADVFKPITLKGRVYILKRLITEPVVQSFQPQQNDKDRVNQLSGLLQKLALPILKQPLIKAKSKYIKKQQPKKEKKKYQSIDVMPLIIVQQKQQKIISQRDQKNKNQLNRIRTDPNYKPKQQSLKDIISKNQQNLREKIIHIQKPEDKIQEGQVHKKVIQIDKQDQKNKFSQLIQLHEDNCEPFYPTKNFKSKLYPYQALALSWMLRREGFLTTRVDKQELHPLWTQYQIPNSSKYHHLYFNQLTGQLCLKRPTAVIKCKGGILADQMGLGKTVMMTSLIVSHPPLNQTKSSQNACTLVIVPLTLLSQWQSEIARHAQNQKAIIYYSSDRKKIANNLSKYDVVLSTYGTISHQFAQGYHTKKQGIYKYKWHRIILDEAHYIKGRIIQTSKAVYELSGNYRWCLTGTPIQNNVTDIFSLLHFIKYTPWSEFACWNRFIVKPLEQEDDSIYNILRTILKQVFLRRTKNSSDSNGKPIIELPPRISKVQLLTMSQKQRQFYDSIYRASRSSFDQLADKGILQAKYMQVLEMLMRLRQICCHPILFKSVTKFSKTTEQFEGQLKKLIQRSQKRKPLSSESQSADQYYEPIIDADNQQIRVKTNGSLINQQYFRQVIQKVASQNLDNCVICLDQPQDPVINCCLHIFCKACNITQIQEKGSCGFCRRTLTKQDFIYLPRQNRMNIKKDKQKQDIFLSTKMIALNQHLFKLKSDDKVVIFSQFLGMLDLLEDEFKKHGYKFVRMQGSNTHKERTKIVKSFQEDPEVKIFLVSLKTAGVGLNLVAANKVFLMDPWWNPAVEEQAIQRVHRIGQKKEVEIIRFILDKTIQTRMLQLNTQKKVLSQNVLNQEKEKDGNKQRIQKLKYLMENY